MTLKHLFFLNALKPWICCAFGNVYLFYRKNPISTCRGLVWRCHSWEDVVAPEYRLPMNICSPRRFDNPWGLYTCRLLKKKSTETKSFYQKVGWWAWLQPHINLFVVLIGSKNLKWLTNSAFDESHLTWVIAQLLGNLEREPSEIQTVCSSWKRALRVDTKTQASVFAQFFTRYQRGGLYLHIVYPWW